MLNIYMRLKTQNKSPFDEHWPYFLTFDGVRPLVDKMVYFFSKLNYCWFSSARVGWVTFCLKNILKIFSLVLTEKMTVAVQEGAAALWQHGLVVRGRSDRWLHLQLVKIILLCRRWDGSVVRHLLVIPKKCSAIPLGGWGFRLCARGAWLALIIFSYNIKQSHGCGVEDKDTRTTEGVLQHVTPTRWVEIDWLMQWSALTASGLQV